MVVKKHLYRYYLHPSYQYTLFLLTSNNSIKGVAVPVLIYPKGKKSKLQNLINFFFACNCVYKAL